MQKGPVHVTLFLPAQVRSGGLYCCSVHAFLSWFWKSDIDWLDTNLSGYWQWMYCNDQNCDFFFLISPVKSQMLGRPVINLVWTELRISTAQYGRKLFFFVTCIHLLNREQARLTQYESSQVCRLCLCSPAPGLLHAVNRVKFNKVFLISKAYADWIAFSIQAKMPVFCLHF